MQKKMPKKQTNMRFEDQTKRLIRLGAKAAGLSQAEFTARAIKEYHLKVIRMAEDDRQSALQSIANGEPNTQSG